MILGTFFPFTMLICCISTLKYLIEGWFRLKVDIPAANRNGVFSVEYLDGSVSSYRVVWADILFFWKVDRIVWVKMMAKHTKIAKEQSPPLADLYYGFSLYLNSSVVLKRSQDLTNFLVCLNVLDSIDDNIWQINTMNKIQLSTSICQQVKINHFSQSPKLIF